MEHKLLTLNHRLESWVYADVVARNAATGFIASDVGRIAYQSDNGLYWRLTSTTPTWVALATGTITLQTTPADLASTTNTGLGVMGGIAATMTPIRSGKIFVSVTGSMRNDTANKGSYVQIYHGTGTPPVAGVAATGTAVPPLPGIYSNNAPANLVVPFNLDGIMTGLSLGTQIWIDIAQASVFGGTTNLFAVSISAFELA